MMKRRSPNELQFFEYAHSIYLLSSLSIPKINSEFRNNSIHPH